MVRFKTYTSNEKDLNSNTKAYRKDRVLSMNLLEHYILNDYKLTKLSKDKTPTNDQTWYRFDGTINCYGSKSHVVKLLTKDEWTKIKKQGYYMA